MTPQQKFATQLTVLAETFGRVLTTPAANGYWLALKDLPEGDLELATRRALTESRFMPTPAELRDLAGHGAKALETEKAAAWEAVRGAMDKYDYTSSVDFGVLVNAVVRNLGGWLALCSTPVKELPWKRKEFERIYGLFSAQHGGLRGEPLRGSFGGQAVRIAIGGKLAPAALPGSDTGISETVRKLAESKGTP